MRERLEAGWSPEQIAGEFKRAHGHCIISHESIYRFIYHRSAQKDYWHRLLPRHKPRRGRFGVRSGPREHIQDRVSIQARTHRGRLPHELGPLGGRLDALSPLRTSILITHERRSRLLLARRQPNKAAAPVARQLLLADPGYT